MSFYTFYKRGMGEYLFLGSIHRSPCEPVYAMTGKTPSIWSGTHEQALICLSELRAVDPDWELSTPCVFRLGGES